MPLIHIRLTRINYLRLIASQHLTFKKSGRKNSIIECEYK